MDFDHESRCPVCRHPYNHFPRICSLLHFLLLKLYPSAYKRRERQVAEEEKESGHASPQFEERLPESNCNEMLDVRDASSPLSGSVDVEFSSTSGHNSLVQDFSKISLPYRDNNTALAMTLSYRDTDEANCMVKHAETKGTLKQVLVTDLQCAVCKQLLFRPVVLNCGHVHCEACTSTQQDSVCKCPVCQCPHPSGFPNVCLVLEDFLEKHFPEEYSARKRSSAPSQKATPSESSMKKREQASQCSSKLTKAFLSGRSGHGPEVHPWVGCDYCGMYPIIGKRYKCTDCFEKMGFDLCEGCYNSSSKLPGRFNQQHTEEHRFTVVPPSNLRYEIVNLGPEGFALGVFNPNDAQEVLAIRESSSSSSEHELENAASNLSDDDLLDQDDAVASRNSFNNGSRNPGDDSAN
ncbi:hypothetical protein CDL12_15837 [Handroanthus impetiginosus]|uniref:E3 ubiquitin ligase n=1 Tax=Handroanthus impetiginosus TaxID=429701 RepID=A0A2G9H201_9LAMI|nr:hypothetical protein CDL12_15837 [Handroanthus impetiginosus]